MGQVAGTEDGVDLHLGVTQLAHQRPQLAGQGGAPDLDRLGHPHLNGQHHVVRAGVEVDVLEERLVGRGAGRRGMRIGAHRARNSRTPRPSSGKVALTHWTRWTGEPSRASEARTEDQAPTRRSCSSAPRRAKLRPRNANAAVSVRALRSWTTPMPRQPVSSRRTPRSAPRGRRPGQPDSAGRPAHRDRQPLVTRPARHRHGGQRAGEHEDDDGRRHARRIGLPTQRQDAQEEPERHRDDLSRPPAGDPAAALTRAEPVALTGLPAHSASSGSCPGGQAAGSHLNCGPCPSSSM